MIYQIYLTYISECTMYVNFKNIFGNNQHTFQSLQCIVIYQIYSRIYNIHSRVCKMLISKIYSRIINIHFRVYNVCCFAQYNQHTFQSLQCILIYQIYSTYISKFAMYIDLPNIFNIHFRI